MSRSIKTQVYAGQLVLVVLLTLVLGGGMFQLAADILERKELEILRLLADSLARETAMTAAQGEDRLRQMAASPALEQFGRNHDYHLFQALFDRYSDTFAALAYINPEGVQEYAGSGSNYTDHPVSVRPDPLVAAALAQPETVVSDLEPSPDASAPPRLIMALARQSPFGRLLGVFRVALPVAAIARPITNLHLEHGGFAVLADAKGLLLSPASPTDTPLGPVDAPRLANALATGSPQLLDIAFGGVPSLIATAPVGLHGLSVLVVQPRALAIDAEMARLRRWALAVAAGAAFVALLSALVWARGVVRPLARLADAARAVTGGDLTVRAPTTGPQETRDLAVAFNAMTTGLAFSRQGLTRAKESLERILANVNEAVWVVDHHGRVSLCNRAGCAMLGYDEVAILGQPATRFFAPNDPLGELLESPPIQHLLADGGMTGMEKTLYGKDGRRTAVLLSLALLRGPHEADAGVVCLAMDISERQRAEALVRARKAAEAVSRAKTEFLAVLSHELRTPLNIMLGMLEHVQSLPLPGQTQSGVGQALASGQSMLDVIAAMLDYASLEADRVFLRRQSFAPGLLAREVASRFAAAARAKDVALVVDLSPRLPAALLGDAERLGQALGNLLGNAVRFTLDGEARLYLGGQPHLTAAGPVWQLLAIISDTGIGVSDAKLEYIFEPFTQEDGSSSRRFGGLGLGLAIARRLVGLMGGSICLDSQLGQGTAVYVSLPLELDAAG
ncbi:PAS domain S-box protein [Desulfovibrio aerotolerans]|uniref:histidine kinase n=1 Tax=Solidesulfovibrio aerotolerans TaxID=295255 RepID=A0A7C9IJA8_9BACT|nr:ATP-binding protein [Solidesulfovibrio aerotolerans]MYL81524.1 PAS domain S-box protein [Solidesulfovibrio aerotolerans]